MIWTRGMSSRAVFWVRKLCKASKDCLRIGVCNLSVLSPGVLFGVVRSHTRHENEGWEQSGAVSWCRNWLLSLWKILVAFCAESGLRGTVP